MSFCLNAAHPGVKVLAEALLHPLRPPTRRTVGEWADAERRVAVGTSPEPGPWRSRPYQRPVMDALSALGRRGPVEEQVAPLLGRSVYVDPFVLRALGLVRQDREAVAEARSAFEALGLAWHADRTRALL